jgi:phosphoserine phosphatase
MVYQPMLELLDALRSHGFDVFIVTGGGTEFVRAVSRLLYGVNPEGVVGTAVTYELQRRDGRFVLTRTTNAREKRYFTGDAHIELISNPVRGE